MATAPVTSAIRGIQRPSPSTPATMTVSTTTPEPSLEDVDDEAQRGEAVGLLVDVHPVQGGGDHHQGEHAQQSQREPQPQPVGRRVAGPAGGRPDDEQGEGGRHGELAEALVDVVGVGEAGGLLEVVVAAEEHRGLGGQEHDEDGVDDEHRHQPLEAVGERVRGPSRRLDAGRVEGERTSPARLSPKTSARHEDPGDEVAEASGWARARRPRLAKSASAEANRAPKTTRPSSDRATVRATAGSDRRCRPAGGCGRTTAAPAATRAARSEPASTNPEGVRASGDATRNTAIAAKTHSRAMAALSSRVEGQHEQQASAVARR